MTLVERASAADNQAAVMALISAGTPDRVEVLTYNQAAEREGNLPDAYVLVSIERRYAPAQHRDGTTGPTYWRTSTRYVADFEDNVRELERLVTAALEYSRVVIDGVTSTPITYDASETARPDKGKYSSSTDWTYVL